MWRCGFSGAKLAHQKSKPAILLSQVKKKKLAGNVCHRLRDRYELIKKINFMRIFVIKFSIKSTTQLPFADLANFLSTFKDNHCVFCP